METNDVCLNFPAVAAQLSAGLSGNLVSSSQQRPALSLLVQRAVTPAGGGGDQSGQDDASSWRPLPDSRYSGFRATRYSVESKVVTTFDPTATASTPANAATTSVQRIGFSSVTAACRGNDDDDHDAGKATTAVAAAYTTTMDAAATTVTGGASTSVSERGDGSAEASLAKPMPKNAVELIVAAISSCPSTTPTLAQIAGHIHRTVPAYSQLELGALVKMVQHHLHSNNPDYFLPVMSLSGQSSQTQGLAKWAINRQTVVVGEDGSVTKRRQRSHPHKHPASSSTPYNLPVRRTPLFTSPSPAHLAGGGEGGHCQSFSHTYTYPCSTTQSGETAYYNYNNNNAAYNGFFASDDTTAAHMTAGSATSVNCVFNSTSATYNVPAAVPVGDAASLYGVPLPLCRGNVAKMTMGSARSHAAATNLAFPFAM